jgi:hypothetical protein
MIKKFIYISSSTLLLASPVTFSQNITSDSFQTPSGNIHCEIYDNNALRCDLMSRTNQAPKKPADCPVDYGNVFELRNNKGGTNLLCYGDTIANPSNPKLPYGAKWSKAGIVCESQTTGLTCTNQVGKGFSISKGNQKLF